MITITNAENGETIPENKIVYLKADGGEYVEYVNDSEGSVDVTVEKGSHTI